MNSKNKETQVQTFPRDWTRHRLIGWARSRGTRYLHIKNEDGIFEFFNDTEQVLNYCLNLLDEIWETGDYALLLRRCSNTGPITAATMLRLLYDEIPEEHKYEIVKAVYLTLKTPTRELREVMQDIKKYRPHANLNPLMKRASKDNTITVYRGTGRKEKRPHLSLSWTLDKDVAIFFGKEYRLTKTRAKHFYIYEAKINIDDVILYTNDRKEFEVIQCNSVKNVKEHKQFICKVLKHN